MVYGEGITSGQLLRVEGAVRQAIETSRNRLLFIAMMFGLCFTVISYQLVGLSLASTERIKDRHLAVMDTTTLKVSRAAIVDRNGVLLATNLNTSSLYANPKQILDVGEAAHTLHQVLPDLDYETLIKRLSMSDKSFVWIKRNLHPKEQLDVHNLGIPGLYYENEEKRIYPHGPVASHVLGFVGVDGNGLAGIEKEYDSALNSGKLRDPDPLQLTLDMRVQAILYTELMQQYQKHEARGAAGIVMDSTNGEIIALVSLPDFDPNTPKRADPKTLFNNATLGVYEMGSTFKTFTMAMALDANIARMDDAYDARKPIKISRFTIRDHHPLERWMTLPEIFMHSSNIGTAKIADQIGAEVQQEYFKKYGMFDAVDVTLPEVGTPLYPDQWRRVNTLTASYGHGIAVTPLHVARAMGATVNGGLLYDPRLVKADRDYQSTRVIREETSELMRRLLHLVVSEGTGKNAGVDGYLVGGKTGTAEKIDGKRYDRRRMVSSFVGAFPMNKPRYVVMAVLDEPKGTKDTYGYATAGWTAAPVVRDIIKQIGPLLGIKPVDETAPEVEKMLTVDYELKPRKQNFASLATR